MSNTPLVHSALSHLRQWAGSIRSELGADGLYVFGSLIHRDGAQFTEQSDVDIVVIIPRQVDNAISRHTWIDRLAERKRLLEADLSKILGHADADSLTCSILAVTYIEVAGDIHKDGARGFFTHYEFMNLITGKTHQGLPGAGETEILGRFVINCIRFAQKQRNGFLGSGRLSLVPYDDSEPLPKELMRHGAMAQHLSDGTHAGPGMEYDTQNGLDFLSHRLYERRNDDPAYADMHNRLSIRRGGRGSYDPVSARDQLLLAEMIYDAATEQLATAERKKAEELPSLRGLHSTVVFAERFAQAFPGGRGIAWYDDPETIKVRLERLLQPPLVYRDGTPIWWWRDGNFQINKFTYVGNSVYLMNIDELKIRRIAAVNPGPYNRNFVYVEVDAMPPTGLYEQTASRIAEVERGEGSFSYFWEEYGIVDDGHLITRAQHDDGAVEMDGRLHDVRGRNELRSRYVTPYNFVIAAHDSPINNSSFDAQLVDILDSMLRGNDRLEELMRAVLELPLRHR